MKISKNSWLYRKGVTSDCADICEVTRKVSAAVLYFALLYTGILGSVYIPTAAIWSLLIADHNMYDAINQSLFIGWNRTTMCFILLTTGLSGWATYVVINPKFSDLAKFQLLVYIVTWFALQIFAVQMYALCMKISTSTIWITEDTIVTMVILNIMFGTFFLGVYLGKKLFNMIKNASWHKKYICRKIEYK